MTTTTTDTYDQVGIREDLSDDIWNIDPTEVPFSSNCSRKKVTNTKFEWQVDDLAEVSDDTAVEGANAVYNVATPTTRLDNYTAILTETAITSGTLEATDRAGRGREMAYQVVKRAKEIKRNFENQIVGLAREKDAGGTTTARITGSYQAYCGTNSSRDGTFPLPAGGAYDGASIPVDGTQRALTEDLLESVIDQIWTSGGNPDVIMANAFNNRAITKFAGNASETTLDRSDKKIINAASLYESDYGLMKVVPNRFVRSRDVLVYQSDMWKIAELRGMYNEERAKVGDAERRQVLMEAGLEACNEKSSGIISDLTTS